MNGFEFLKTLRSDERLKKIRVFIITTSAEPEDKEKLQAHGISGYIVKPLDFTNYNNSKDNLTLLIDLINQ
jgi:CheY-like chemotaxis protein